MGFEIENGGLENCTEEPGVTVVVVPEGVTEIGGWAFSGCKNLIIRCRTGSYAEQYAKENEIEYVTTEE